MSDKLTDSKQTPPDDYETIRTGESVDIDIHLATSSELHSEIIPYKKQFLVSEKSHQMIEGLQITREQFAALKKTVTPIARRLVSKAGLHDIDVDTEDAASYAIEQISKAHLIDFESVEGVKDLKYYYRVATKAINGYITEQKKLSGYIPIKMTTKDVLLHMNLEDMYNYAHSETGRNYRHLTMAEMKAWMTEHINPNQEAGDHSILKNCDDVEVDIDEEIDVDEVPVAEKPKHKNRPPRFGMIQSDDYLNGNNDSVSFIDQAISTNMEIGEILDLRRVRQIIISSWEDCIRLVTGNRAKTAEIYKTAFEMFWTAQDENTLLTAKDIAKKLDLSEASISSTFHAIYGCLKMKLIEQRAIDFLEVSETFKRAASIMHQSKCYDLDGVEVKFFDRVRFSKSICLARFCSLNSISESYVLKLHYQYKSKIKAWIDLCLQVEALLNSSKGEIEIPSDILKKINVLAQAM